MPPALLVATTNPGKIREIRAVLATLPIQLVTLEDVGPCPEPLENGATFAENAMIKAIAYAGCSGLPTVAEDSGLAIDALGGRPGVASARYPGNTYADKFQGLYGELGAAPRPWTARFVCSLAFVDPERRLGRDAAFACEAAVEGEVLPAPRGEGGFGYDPIFYFPAFDRTLAEASADEKLSVSHRGRAFRRFRDWLRD